MEALIRQAGLAMLHVPFTGAAPAATAMVSGQVDAMFLNAGPAEADGARRQAADPRRRRRRPHPATAGGADARRARHADRGGELVRPAGPGRPAGRGRSRLAAVTAEALAAPQVQEMFRVQAALPVTGTPAEMRDFLAADRARWTAVVKNLDIRLE